MSAPANGHLQAAERSLTPLSPCAVLQQVQRRYSLTYRTLMVAGLKQHVQTHRLLQSPQKAWLHDLDMIWVYVEGGSDLLSDTVWGYGQRVVGLPQNFHRLICTAQGILSRREHGQKLAFAKPDLLSWRWAVWEFPRLRDRATAQTSRAH